MPKGMMLAAGRGTRLGPLTENLPKPLLPVANRPVMAQGIHALRRLGIDTVCANVSYRGQQIRDIFMNGRAHGVNLHWLQEPEPTGTAGGMKAMQSWLESDVIVVIAGDAMLDLDLAPLLAAHHAHKAFATLATIEVADPSQYGVVVTDSSSRVVRFQEKPLPGTEISRQANTGIYILEPEVFDLIPAGEFCDFALNVFPEILRRRLPFFAFPVTGYWTDIGNPSDYLQANLDYLAGRIRVEGRGQRINGSLIARDAVVTGAKLSECIIGDTVALPSGTQLSRCVVWPGTKLDEPISVSSAIITPYGVYPVAEQAAVQPARPPVSV